MIRVFDYLNMSNMKNIWADSGFHVQVNVINYILERRNDFFFYLTVPREIVNEARRAFKYPEYVKLLPVKYYTQGTLNKLFIDPESIMDVFKWKKYMVNIIWSNEAYATSLLVHLFKGVYPFTEASVASYVHWLEIPEQNRISNGSVINWHLWYLFISHLFSDYVFYNSWYGVDLVKSYFSRILDKRYFDIVSSKMTPLYLGINVEELDKYKTTEKFDKVTFVFNQRLMSYTGAPVVINVVERLVRSGYREFQVVFTNPSKHSLRSSLSSFWEKYRGYVVAFDRLPWEKYVEILWKSDAVIAWHQGITRDGEAYPVNQWSLALLEGVACGNYPVIHRNGFYREMFPGTEFPPGREEALYEVMRRIIESPEEYKKKAIVFSQRVRERFDWRYRIRDWIEYFEKLYALSQGNSSKLKDETIKKLKKFLKDKRIVKWGDIYRYMNWGTQIKHGRISVYHYLCKYYRELPKPEPEFVIETPGSRRKSILEFLGG